MSIGTFRPNQTPALHALYRRETERSPHCRFVPSVSALGHSLTHSAQAGTEFLIAEDGGEARGLAALTPLAAHGDLPRRTAITALLASDETVGQELLRACLDGARAARQPVRAFPDAHNCSPISAYNGGWGGLSDGLPMAARLLARGGFTPYYRELHLSLADCHTAGRPTAPPSGVTLQVRPAGNNSEERRWCALRDGQEVGVCAVSSVAHLTDDPAAAHWGYVQGLEVDERYRRQGIARWLMTTALAQIADEGFAGCWLTTGAANWGAQRLYLSLGFEVVDASTSFWYENASKST